MNQSALEKNLAELGISAIRFFDSIGSTNDEALTWAAEGSPDCALVVADEQTKGRGRLNRHWIT
jgi:BirA family biotin operon repressor/biotin-[acetyl-CoA-carboxylase] ligase